LFFSSWITSCGRSNDENLNNNLSDLAVNIEIIGKSSSFINGDGTG
jgi:hypothetical protein